MDRNPFDATAALRVGHTGLRHSAEIGGAAGYGNGQNVQSGGNSTQLNANASASYDYLVNDYVTAGAYASYYNLLTTYEDSDLDGSDIAQLRGGASLEWLATGKTTFGVSGEAGRVTQTVKQQELVVVGPRRTVPQPPEEALALQPHTVARLVPERGNQQLAPRPARPRRGYSIRAGPDDARRATTALKALAVTSAPNIAQASVRPNPKAPAPWRRRFPSCRVCANKGWLWVCAHCKFMPDPMPGRTWRHTACCPRMWAWFRRLQAGPRA
jgi:hypothetical protein